MKRMITESSLGDVRRRGFTGFARTGFVDGHDAELILLAFFQSGHLGLCHRFLSRKEII